jgi:hypothetical protein
VNQKLCVVNEPPLPSIYRPKAPIHCHLGLVRDQLMQGRDELTQGRFGQTTILSIPCGPTSPPLARLLMCGPFRRFGMYIV